MIVDKISVPCSSLCFIWWFFITHVATNPGNTDVNLLQQFSATASPSPNDHHLMVALMNSPSPSLTGEQLEEEWEATTSQLKNRLSCFHGSTQSLTPTHDESSRIPEKMQRKRKYSHTQPSIFNPTLNHEQPSIPTPTSTPPVVPSDVERAFSGELSGPSLEEIPNHPLQFKTDIEHPGCCTSVGTLSEPLLQEFSSDFDKELKLYSKTLSRLSTLIKHPSLPFALTGLLSDSTWLTRVLSKSSQGTKTQQRRVLSLLFRMLISWTYEFLEQTLNHFDAPIFAYRIHQRRFLGWLREQIFPSHTSNTDNKHIRIFQFIRPPCPTWEKDFSDGSLGLTQIHLINFFSTNKDNTELAKVTAAYLVETYLANKENLDAIKIKTSNKFGKGSEEVQDNEEFNQMFSHLSKLAIEPIIPCHQKIPKHERYAPITSTLESFSKQCRIIEEKIGSNTSRMIHKIYHPRLPIAVCFSGENPGIEPIRLLQSQEKKCLTEQVLYTNVRRLIFTADQIHLELLERSTTPEEEHKRVRERFLRWVLEQIFSPKDSIPVLGIHQTNRFLTPWDQPDQLNLINSFGKIQVKLIEYLSQFGPLGSDEMSQNAKMISYFLLATWYSIEN
ncbi:hypothetical protein PGT21_020372 [Puccinia graminis f. sp. tritici]|uniref:Ras-GEF domain-containing protein n=1 Tax=Puccinia graminis f. sp. tritici TaxID=56615 RepID=A0A5B0S1G0_PUCGR|nr:hypothetical protein PGT21_020372 [Puccinia graminis f. sp. tritici]KAA1131880.1 hypothetical protein PGTUg99_032051 [Puccinia graminis f. sp. tritici]